MRIHLIRHGRPACLPQRSLSRRGYACWVQDYDNQGISDQPPDSLRDWYGTSNIKFVYASSRQRSIQSAEALSGANTVCIDPLFNEAAISVAPIPLRLSSATWTVIGRSIWLWGVPSHEKRKEFHIRAHAAAEVLLKSAATAETALFGHGWMNGIIGRELLNHGLRVLHPGGNNYWSKTSFWS